MEATASAPIAVASSSNTAINNTNQCTSSTPDDKPVETQSWRIKPRPENPVPVATASSSTNVQNSTESNWRVKSEKNTNSDNDASVQNKNGGAENDNNNRPGNANKVFSPQRRRNRNRGSPNGDGQNQTAQEDVSGKILVTGYPTYTQPHDLLDVFAKFGSVRIDKCSSRSAALTFAAPEPARRAVAAAARLHVYGHFLCVRPYSAKPKPDDGPHSPRKDFTMSKQKKEPQWQIRLQKNITRLRSDIGRLTQYIERGNRSKKIMKFVENILRNGTITPEEHLDILKQKLAVKAERLARYKEAKTMYDDGAQWTRKEESECHEIIDVELEESSETDDNHVTANLHSSKKALIIEPSKIDLTGDFHAQLDKIMAAIRLNQDEINKIQQLYADLELAFQEPWPGCTAIPFGSIITGLGIKTSDADCYINLPPQYRSVHGNHVNRARRLLMQYPAAFAEILAIPRANTPIVKLYHIPTSTNCDITFKTPLGARNSRLISFLLRADPRITPVAVIVKYWAKVHELSGTGRLTNYTLTMMIIFYLQQPTVGILPSVEWLQRDRNNDLFVDYWNTGFMDNPNFLPKTSNKSTISELLGGFFEYYSVFNFDEMVVCPFLGVPIKKEAFRDTASLPSEFDIYKNNVLSNIVMPIRYQTPFCVQDPFEQCHNVASTVTSKLALDIITYFKFAASAYEKEKANGCTGFFKNILIEKPKLIRGKTAPEYRVNLFPRIINTIIDFEWKNVVRKLSKTIFENMLKIKLGKVEEKLSPDSGKEKEKYMGRLTKPIWKRKKYNYNLQITPQMGIEERQSLISEELLQKEVQPVSLQFQLTLTFCHDPKSAVISIRMISGDLNAFREFGKFFISVMQNWFMQLLKPHALPNCKDTAAKIAETVEKDNKANDVQSDDNDEENEILIEDSAAEKLAQEIREITERSLQKHLDNMTVNDEAPPEAAKQLKDVCANQ